MQASELLSATFLAAHPEDAARVLERLSPAEQARLLGRSPATVGAQVLQRFPPTVAAACLMAMAAPAAGAILEVLPLDLKVNVIRPLGEPERTRLLATVEPTAAEPLLRLLRYPEGSAGALMDPYVLTLPEDISVAESLRRAKASRHGLLYYLYVIDRQQRLVGVTTLRQLMRARVSEPLARVMEREVCCINANARSEEVAKSPHWRAFHALPVVDDKGFFLGVIRYETLQRLQDEVQQADHEGSAMDTILALGELYWIGLSGMLRGASAEVEERSTQRRDTDDGD